MGAGGGGAGGGGGGAAGGAATGGAAAGGAAADSGSGTATTFLQGQEGYGPNCGRQHEYPGTGVGEGELVTAHFIVNSWMYCEEPPTKWLVTSIDTDQWMIILLAMAVGKIRWAGPGKVDVTVKRVLSGGTDYIWVNRVYGALLGLTDGCESAWPKEDVVPWLVDDSLKVALFALVYLISGCDFLPAFTGLPFRNMWKFLLKGLLQPGLFPNPIILRNATGLLVLDVVECTRLMATAFYFMHERRFLAADQTPATILEAADGNVSNYISLIRQSIWNMNGGNSRGACPPEISFWLQGSRADAVAEYWQGAFGWEMPEVKFKGRGWDTAGWDEKEELTKTNVIMPLSEHGFIDNSGKSHVMKCGCSPDAAANKHGCKTCTCWRSYHKDCSIHCGCGRVCLT